MLSERTVRKHADNELRDLDHPKGSEFYELAMKQIVSGIGYWESKREITRVLEDYNEMPSLLYYYYFNEKK